MANASPRCDVLGDDEEESDRLFLIELSSGGASGPAARRAGRSPAALPTTNGGGRGLAARRGCRSAVVAPLLLAVLAAAYFLGIEEGKRDGGSEGEADRGGTPAATQIPRPEGGVAADGTSIGRPAEHAPPIANKGKFMLDHINNVRAECKKIIELLENYYSGKEQTVNMLANSFIDPWDFDASEGDEPAKYHRASKMVDTIARALVDDSRSQFIIGGMGSSVMAGHDNCFYDNYGSQMERLWGPAWEAAGMDFVFHNAGIGGGCGDSYANEHFCAEQLVSSEVDVVHYEWTYYEHGEGHAEHEDLIRWLQLLPRRPPVHIFNTGTVPTPMFTGPDTVQWPPDTELTSHYAKQGFNAFYLRSAFLNGGHDYEDEKNRDEDPFDRFSPGFTGDGYHNTTRYGENETDEARRSSLGVVMRNWHPGPMGFQLTSDAFTYAYTMAMMRALELIENDLIAGNDPRKTWAVWHSLSLSMDDLPTPKYCDPELCLTAKPPRCLNYEQPTFGASGLRVAADLSDQFNPYRNELQNWHLYKRKIDFWGGVGKQDEAVFRMREDKGICQHHDHCGGISSSEKAGDTVVFELPKMEVGLVVICGCCGKEVGRLMFIEYPDVEISIDGVAIPRDEWELWPNKKCVRVRQRFQASRDHADQLSYLAVKDNNDMRGMIIISHVITL